MLNGVGFDQNKMTQWGGFKWDLDTERRLSDSLFLDGHGYKVYSQNDEDGIIQEIFRRIGTTDKTFVEIGVGDGIECNTHYLLFLGWKGLWIEASATNAEAIKHKFSYVVNEGILKVAIAVPTRENINDLLSEASVSDEIDLLSIDIDGNDYYIFEALSRVRPRVIVIEYNGKFPPECSWCMPYCEEYTWNGTDRHGASLKALEELAAAKGYVLVGTNITGANAFFVRADLAQGLFPTPSTAENLYNPSRLFLTFKNGHQADVCLVNPTLQMEYLFNGIDDAYVAAYGFHPREFHEDGVSYHQWMSQMKAAGYLRIDEKHKGCLEIIVRYSAIDYGLYGIKKPKLRIATAEYGYSDFSDVEEYGEITLRLSKPLDTGQIVKIEFEISELWTPSDVLCTPDDRDLGIAVLNVAPLGGGGQPFAIVGLELTNRCEMKCIMCPRTYAMNREIGDMDMSLFTKIIDEYAAVSPLGDIGHGTGAIWLHLFGESLLSPIFGEAISYASQKGLKPMLSINPSALDSDKMHRLLNAEPHLLYLMVDGNDEESFSHIRGVDGQYEKTVENALDLLQLKRDMGSEVQVYVCTIDIPGREEIVDAARSYWEGVDGVDGFIPVGFVDWNGSIDEITCLGNGLPSGNCAFPWQSVCITWDGSVVPCCYDYDKFYPLGNLNEESLMDIWKGDAMRGLREEIASGGIKNALCAKCRLGGRGTGCLA